MNAKSERASLPDRVEAARMNKWRDVLERLMIAEFALDSQGDRSGRRVNMSVEKRGDVHREERT